MTIRTGFFNSEPKADENYDAEDPFAEEAEKDDRGYDADDFNTVMCGTFTDGRMGGYGEPLDQFIVSSTANTYEVKVSPGAYLLRGMWLISDEIETLKITQEEHPGDELAVVIRHRPAKRDLKLTIVEREQVNNTTDALIAELSKSGGGVITVTEQYMNVSMPITGTGIPRVIYSGLIGTSPVRIPLDKWSMVIMLTDGGSRVFSGINFKQNFTFSTGFVSGNSDNGNSDASAYNAVQKTHRHRFSWDAVAKTLKWDGRSITAHNSGGSHGSRASSVAAGEAPKNVLILGITANETISYLGESTDYITGGARMVVPIPRGGTSAETAADARYKLEITPANIGAATEEEALDIRDVMGGHIGLPEWDADTFAIKFTTENGAESTVNLPLETLLKNPRYDPETKEIVVDTQEGTELRVSVADLVDIYEGSTGTQIQIVIDPGNIIKAALLGDSIDEDKLKPALRNKINSALQVETDPTVPDWAKAEEPPTYTASDIGLGNVTNDKQARHVDVGDVTGLNTNARTVVEAINEVLETGSSGSGDGGGGDGAALATHENKMATAEEYGHVKLSNKVLAFNENIAMPKAAYLFSNDDLGHHDLNLVTETGMYVEPYFSSFAHMPPFKDIVSYNGHRGLVLNVVVILMEIIQICSVSGSREVYQRYCTDRSSPNKAAWKWSEWVQIAGPHTHPASEITDMGVKTIVNTYIEANQWEDGEYAINNSRILSRRHMDIKCEMDVDATQEEIDADRAAVILPYRQEPGKVVLKAYGTVPAIDLPYIIKAIHYAKGW